MKPTDEERREVAARLREPYPRFTNLVDAFGLTAPVPIHELRYRLADLIEPEERTCRVVTDIRAFSQTQDMHTKSCSACGYVFGSEEHRQLLAGLGEGVAIDPVVIPNYCPKCGARVVTKD